MMSLSHVQRDKSKNKRTQTRVGSLVCLELFGSKNTILDTSRRLLWILFCHSEILLVFRDTLSRESVAICKSKVLKGECTTRLM